jgi:ubiquinone/menaquinone biosynthesis C-methylase UbiE
MPSALDRLTFSARQVGRISWFFGQKLLASRVTRPVPLPEPLRGRTMPDTRRILQDLWRLIQQDWQNVEAGYYLSPSDGSDSPFGGMRRAADFFADLSAVERRRHSPSEECRLTEVLDRGYPPYYLQKFHFQSDGYLSDLSARRYDHQVEVLFGGAAAVMRRQGLLPLRAALTRRRAERLLDVGCGTGCFLREVKANHPRLQVIGLDLSPYYLAVARQKLQPWSRARFVEGMAEAMPFGDQQFDAVTCIYLFHELPPEVRRAVVDEIRRVLRPGGMLVFVDSLQTGDEPDYDAMLEYFPIAFHEPYYASYLEEDLDRLWSPGFTPEARLPAYFSKVLSYRRNR